MVTLMTESSLKEQSEQKDILIRLQKILLQECWFYPNPESYLTEIAIYMQNI